MNVSRSTAALMRQALADAARTGPFFRLEVIEGGATAGWLPVAALRPGALSWLVTDTAARLGTSEMRVAASIAHQSLAARLWAPVLGCGLLGGVVPDLGSLVVSARPPVRLGITDLTGCSVSTAEELADLAARAVGGTLSALAAALPGPLADGLLRGNSASAVVGALTVLRRARPGTTEPSIALARMLLQHRELAGAGTLADDGLAFRRRSCCLYYRVPGGGLCGDCCFTG